MRVSVSRPRNEENVDVYNPLPGPVPESEQLESVYQGDVTSDMKRRLGLGKPL